MPGEEALERAVLERQVEPVSLDERRVGSALGRDREHPRALVEPRHVARQVAGEEAGAAGDVERPLGRQCLITAIKAASSSSQPGRSRSAYLPRPRYQSSYSGARVS